MTQLDVRPDRKAPGGCENTAHSVDDLAVARGPVALGVGEIASEPEQHATLGRRARVVGVEVDVGRGQLRVVVDEPRRLCVRLTEDNALALDGME